MANLIFLEEPHKYELDGEELPSVSEITRFISREMYSEVNQSVLDNAANRGTNVHRATESLDRYGDCEVDDDLVPYLQAYVEFRKAHEVKWDKIEWSTYNAERKYGMTVDRVGVIDGKMSLLDIKSTYALHKVALSAQLTLYAMGLKTQGIEVEKLYALHLKKDGTYKLVEIEKDEQLAESCLYLHEKLKKKKRKRKGE